MGCSKSRISRETIALRAARSPSSPHWLSNLLVCKKSASSWNTQQASFVAVCTPSGQATRLKLAADARVARARRPTESLKTIVDALSPIESSLTSADPSSSSPRFYTFRKASERDFFVLVGGNSNASWIVARHCRNRVSQSGERQMIQISFPSSRAPTDLKFASVELTV